jgi:DNA-binding NarL/FixJ family response regulator
MPLLPRILVAEDDPLAAEGIRRVLAQIPAEVELSFTPGEVKIRLVQSRFDLLVLDISFRDSEITGFDLLRESREALPALPVLMVSMFDGPELREEARTQGARGFVSKMAIGSALVAATRVVLAGGNSFPITPALRSTTLSVRQLQVSEELRQGLHEKEIAAKLGLSVSMVESHLKKAKKTVKARSLMQLVAIFVRRGYQLLPRNRGSTKEPGNPTG